VPSPRNGGFKVQNNTVHSLENSPDPVEKVAVTPIFDNRVGTSRRQKITQKGDPDGRIGVSRTQAGNWQGQYKDES